MTSEYSLVALAIDRNGLGMSGATRAKSSRIVPFGVEAAGVVPKALAMRVIEPIVKLIANDKKIAEVRYERVFL